MADKEDVITHAPAYDDDQQQLPTHVDQLSKEQKGVARKLLNKISFFKKEKLPMPPLSYMVENSTAFQHMPKLPNKKNKKAATIHRDYTQEEELLRAVHLVNQSLSTTEHDQIMEQKRAEQSCMTTWIYYLIGEKQPANLYNLSSEDLANLKTVSPGDYTEDLSAFWSIVHTVQLEYADELGKRMEKNNSTLSPIRRQVIMDKYKSTCIRATDAGELHSVWNEASRTLGSYKVKSGHTVGACATSMLEAGRQGLAAEQAIDTFGDRISEFSDNLLELETNMTDITTVLLQHRLQSSTQKRNTAERHTEIAIDMSNMDGLDTPTDVLLQEQRVFRQLQGAPSVIEEPSSPGASNDSGDESLIVGGINPHHSTEIKRPQSSAAATATQPITEAKSSMPVMRTKRTRAPIHLNIKKTM